MPIYISITSSPELSSSRASFSHDQVELVDGMLLTEELPVTPDLSVGKVVEICTHFLELTDPRSDCMGIFVYDIPPEEGNPDPDADKPYADLER